MANNVVLRKFTAPAGSPAELGRMYAQPAYRAMTLDDVVQRVAAMFAVLLTAGALAWVLTPEATSGPVVAVAALAGVGLGLYMSFTARANAATALAYAAFEGVLLGAVSRMFNAAYPGVVVQAVTGTVMVAGGMLVVYKTGSLRVTPKFTKMVVAGTLGVFGLMLVNLVAYLFTPAGLGLRNGGPLAVVFSVVCIALAALNLVMDFDRIERAVASGRDARQAWYPAFALTVTLIWLYLEILRLLSYFNGGGRR